MLQDSDRLLHLIEQVLRAGQKGRVPLPAGAHRLGGAGGECIDAHASRSGTSRRTRCS